MAALDHGTLAVTLARAQQEFNVLATHVPLPCVRPPFRQLRESAA